MPTPARQLHPRLDQPLRASASRIAHPLDPATRARFEPHFGYDLSRVRIYCDATSAALAAHLGAAAYTVGQHIHFGAGQYAPRTVAGQRLLAHELAHVVQQAEGIQGRSVAVLEAEAEQRTRYGCATHPTATPITGAGPANASVLPRARLVAMPRSR